MASDVEVRTDIGSCQTVVAIEDDDQEVVLLAAVHDRVDPTDVEPATDALERTLDRVVREDDPTAVVADGGER